MDKEKHVAALVRIIALRVAKGKKDLAESYLKWAYSDTSVTANEPINEKTFIKKYLSPVKKMPKRKELRKFFFDYQGRNLGSEVVTHILKMKYSDFLETFYWRAVSLHVKDEAGRTCSICGQRGGYLDVHHNTYQHHGDEMNHLEDLTCVCRECHKKIHELLAFTEATND